VNPARETLREVDGVIAVLWVLAYRR